MKEHHYLDNAATTWPKPEIVYTTMDEFFRGYGVNPGRAGHELAVEAERMIVETRRLLAEFFGFKGDTNRVVFTQNATDSLNTALYGVLNDGDHVITTRLEHNAVIRPLNHMQRDNRITVTSVSGDDPGFVDPADIKRAITPATRVIVVNHASNVLGSVQDIAAIGRISREAGTLFIVDSCQSAGVLPIDMDEIGIDILAFTGHKGLFGPMGIGGMVVRDGIDVRPIRVGGTGVDSASRFQPDEYPFHLEAGTVALPGIAGLNAAQKWFARLGREQIDRAHADLPHKDACRAGLEYISRIEHDHVRKLANAFRDVPGLTVYGPQDNQPRVATLSIGIDGMPADQAGVMLDADYHVCVRAGLHCAPLVHEDRGTVANNGTIRFAPGYFTEDDDVDQAILGVTELAA